MPPSTFTLLRGLTDADQAELLDRARRRSFSPGEVVFHAGDPADALHLVRKGRFAVRLQTPFGDVATINVVGPGDAFGELALLTPDAPRSATVAALDEAETWCVHEVDFRRIREQRPQLNALLVELLSGRVRELSGQLLDALHLPADLRVRRRLLDVVALYGPETTAVTVPLTQEELASLAGTSRATVNRVLREEQEHGAVELQRGRTVVLDADAIRRRAEPFGGR